MIVASIGAIAVFVTVLSYVSSVRAEVGDMVTVLRLKEDVRANSAITKSKVEEAEVPRRWLSGPFISETSQLDGKVAVNKLEKGSYLQRSMVVDAPRLRAGQREIAIMIDAETGVAGKVQPGSLVNIYATYTATSGQRTKTCATRVLSATRVIDVGKLRTTQGESGQNGDQAELGHVVPVTFALSPSQSLKLTWAESFATKVRLALIGPGTTEEPPEKEVCTVDPTAGRSP